MDEKPNINAGDIVLYKCPYTNSCYTTIVVESKEIEQGIFYHLSSPNSKKLFWSKIDHLTLLRSFNNQTQLDL